MGTVNLKRPSAPPESLPPSEGVGAAAYLSLGFATRECLVVSRAAVLLSALVFAVAAA
jgi:hypothetical protein